MVFIFTDHTFFARRIGSYRLASALRKIGVEVEVIDFLPYWNIDKLIQIFDKIQKIEWIGFSLTYINLNKDVEKFKAFTDLKPENELKLINYFKNRNVPIVLGGPSADAIKNFISNYIIVLGYADSSIIALHNHITKNDQLKFEYINGNKVVFSDRDYVDIKLSEVETVFKETDYISNHELLPIEISRGCIFKCKFCEFPHIGKKPGTYIRPKESIKSDIVRAYTDYNVKDFLFVDDTFNDSVEKMQLIVDVREETNIPFTFWSYGRLDLLIKNRDMFDLIGKTGWKAITFGIETLNKRTGSSVGKGADPEKQKNTLLELRSTYPDIYLQANLIVGLPHSTKQDIKESVDWFLQNDAVNWVRVVALDIQDSRLKNTGSIFSKDPTKFGYNIISSDSLRYNWQNDTWSLEEARKFADEMAQYVLIEQTKKKKYLQSFHFGHHIKRFLKEGFTTKEQIDNKFKNYISDLNYVQNKLLYLENMVN